MKSNVPEVVQLQALKLLQVKNLPADLYVNCHVVISCYNSKTVCDTNSMFVIKNWCSLHDIKITEIDREKFKNLKELNQAEALGLAVVCRSQKQLSLKF